METYENSGGITPQFLTSTLVGGGWSDSRSCRFTSRETVPGTDLVGDRIHPRTGLNITDPVAN